MYTTCPDCSSVYAITPEEIAMAGGLVRCGNCDATFSAVRRLSATAPAGVANADDTADEEAPDQSSLDFAEDSDRDDLDHKHTDEVSAELAPEEEAPVSDQYVELDSQEFMDEADDIFDELTEFATPPQEFIEAVVDVDDTYSDAHKSEPDSPETANKSGKDSVQPDAGRPTDDELNFDDPVAASADAAAQPGKEDAEQLSAESFEDIEDEPVPDDALEQWDTEEGEQDLETLLADDDFMSDEFNEKDDDERASETDAADSAPDSIQEPDADEQERGPGDTGPADGEKHDTDQTDAGSDKSDTDTNESAVTVAPGTDLEGTDAIENDHPEPESPDNDQDTDQVEHIDAPDQSDEPAEPDERGDNEEPDAAADETDQDDPAADEDSESDAQFDDEDEPASQDKESALNSQDILVENVDGRFDSQVNDAHDYEDISQYLQPAKSIGRRITEFLMVALLVTALVAQYIHHERARLATEPKIGDMIQNAYSTLGLDLNPAWRVSDYRIARHTIVPHQLEPQVLMARATIINNSVHERPMPLLRLQIKNRWGDIVYARIFNAQEYLTPEPAAELAGYARVEAAVDFINPTEDAEIGYSFDVCLRAASGAIDCGEKEIFSR